MSNFIIECTYPNRINLIVFAGNEHTSDANLMQQIDIEVLAYTGVVLVQEHHGEE